VREVPVSAIMLIRYAACASCGRRGPGEKACPTSSQISFRGEPGRPCSSSSLAAKARRRCCRAAPRGRGRHPTPLAVPVLRHRIVVGFRRRERGRDARRDHPAGSSSRPPAARTNHA
jgi:hypothetical protein